MGFVHALRAQGEMEAREETIRQLLQNGLIVPDKRDYRGHALFDERKMRHWVLRVKDLLNENGGKRKETILIKPSKPPILNWNSTKSLYSAARALVRLENWPGESNDLSIPAAAHCIGVNQAVIEHFIASQQLVSKPGNYIGRKALADLLRHF